MMAIDKDPTAQVAAERLAQLYRDKGDAKALAALLDRRAKALAPLATQNDELRGELAGMHEELGRLWAERAALAAEEGDRELQEGHRARSRRAPTPFTTRASSTSSSNSGRTRSRSTLRSSSSSRIQGGASASCATKQRHASSPATFQGATRALAQAREIDGVRPRALQQEYASSVLDRIQAGEAGTPATSARHAAELLVDARRDLRRRARARAMRARRSTLSLVTIGPSSSSRTTREPLGQPPDMLARAATPTSRPTRTVRWPTRCAPRSPRRRALASSPGAVYRTGRECSRGRRASSTSSWSRTSSGEPASRLAERAIVAASPAPGAASAMPCAEGRLDSPALLGETAGIGRRGTLSPDKLQGILDAAQMLAGKGKKPRRLQSGKEVLDSDPAHPEALAWTEDYLRSKRDYGQLRDVLPRQHPRSGQHAASSSRHARSACARSPACARATSATSTARSRPGASFWSLDRR